MKSHIDLGLGFYRLTYDFSVDELVEVLRENELAHVELHLEEKDLAEQLGREFSISLQFPPWIGLWQESEDRAREWFKEQLASLSKMNVANDLVLVVHPAISLPGESSKMIRSKLFEDSIAFFRIAGEVARESGCVVCLENLTHGMSRMRIGDKVEELVELRRAIGFEDIKFCFDIGHHIMSLRFLEERPIMREFLDNVSMVHIHGVEGRDRHREKWWDHYPLGGNSIPWEGYVWMLQDRDYEGAIVLEIFRGLEEDPSLKREQLSGSFDALRRTLRHAP